MQMEYRPISEWPASLVLHQQKVRSFCWFAVDVIVAVKAVMESVLHACLTPTWPCLQTPSQPALRLERVSSLQHPQAQRVLLQ